MEIESRAVPIDALAETLVNLEKKLLVTEFRQSKEFLKDILHDDFVEIGASGRRYDKQTAINQVYNQSKTDYSLSDFRVLPLSDNVVLLTYRLTTSSDAAENLESVRSSVWKKANKTWQIIFHQGTKI